MLRYPIRGEKFSFAVEISKRLFSKRSAFQQIDIVDTDAFGRMLILDGHVQLAMLDEFAYHEALVHIPLASVPDPKRALIVGGGDGGVVRELSRWSSLESIDMVEIDREVIDACTKFLPEISRGAFEDTRVHVYVEDAFKFLANVEHPYDFVVLDITDTYEEEEGELSEQLFTESFVLDVSNALSQNGFVVMQADNHVFCPYSAEHILAVFGRVFANVGFYQALVPSFGGFSGFCWGSKAGTLAKEWRYPGLEGLRYLNGTTYTLATQELGFRTTLEG